MGAMFSDANKTIPAGVGGQFTFDAAQSAQMARSIPNYNSLPAAYQQAIRNKIANTAFTVELTGPTIIGSKTDTRKSNFHGPSRLR